MTLQGFINSAKLYRKSLLASVLLAAVLGSVLAQVSPASYRASGLLFVFSPAQPVPDRFSYEGFYSQQVGDRYGKTVAGVLESKQLLSQARSASKLGESISLRQLSSRVNVSLPGPQLISLQVSAPSYEEAVQWWQVISDQLINANSRLHNLTGVTWEIYRIWEEPLVETKKISWWLGGLCGVLVSLMGWLVYIISTSLKDSNNHSL